MYTVKLLGARQHFNHSGPEDIAIAPTDKGQANLNSGASWTNVTPNLPFNPAATQATGIAVDPNNANKAVLSISGFTGSTGIGHIFKTADFGATWSRADGAEGPSPLPDVPVLRVLVDRTDATGNTLYAATDIGVFQSLDGGATWAAFNLGTIPAVPVFDIEQNSNGTIFVATHGRGAYQLVLGP